eukprot:6483229-Amphidinium_carterae.2
MMYNLGCQPLALGFGALSKEAEKKKAVKSALAAEAGAVFCTSNKDQEHEQTWQQSGCNPKQCSRTDANYENTPVALILPFHSPFQERRADAV